VIVPGWPSVLSASVVPVVIISACGLLSLAFYGRLAAVVSRLRGFQREMLVEQEKMQHQGQLDHSPLLNMLKTQTVHVTRRARLIRRALLFFLVAVAFLIVCSLTLVLSWFVRAAAFFAGIFFVLGLFSMLAGVISAMMELRGALQPVELEARFVSESVDPSLAESRRESEALAGAEEESGSEARSKG
jgi:hypothetical protein